MNLKSEMLEVVGNLWIVYNHIIIVYFLKKTMLRLVSGSSILHPKNTKGPGAKNDTSESPGCFNQILTFESRKWSPVATF